MSIFPIRVTLANIAAKDQKLNIPRYIASKDEREAPTAEEAAKRLQESATTAEMTHRNLLSNGSLSYRAIVPKHSEAPRSAF
jgi:hypothetical protein